jgi:broad specificity phosphatase PhoE
MILYLIRHGKSQANLAGLVTGTLEDPLTEEGISQAQSLGMWLDKAGINGTRFITSTWKRAQQTANILWPQTEWQIESRIGETNAGQVAQWQIDKFTSAMPTFSESHENAYPGGESHQDLNKRVLDWLCETTERNMHQEKVVLVAHSGPISCILQHVVGLEMDRFPAFLPAHASISIINFPATNTGLAPKLLAFSICPAERVQTSFIDKSSVGQ